MRILMVHPHDINSSIEPWTRRIKSFAGELTNRGHQVKLVYFPLSGRSRQRYFSDGYEVVPLQRVISPAVFIRNIWKLTELTAWADIVHFQKCHYYSAAPAVIAAYLKGKPLHYDWDDWEEMIWYESWEKGIQSRFIGFSFRIPERLLPVLSDTVSVSSQYLRDLTRKNGARKEDIFLIPVGADLEKFNPGIDGSEVRRRHNIRNSLVLYLGQLHGAQYIDLFIRAANIVLHKNPQLIFMIVGGGFKEDKLKSLAGELGINDRIIFTGSVPQDKVPEYIAAADVCVAPFRETRVTCCKSPLKIAEYMACGKAIVASNVGEIRRMLGGVGVLAQPDDHCALAEGILTILNGEKELSDNLGKYVRRRAEWTYNWQVAVSKLSAAYEKLYVNQQKEACA